MRRLRRITPRVRAGSPRQVQHGGALRGRQLRGRASARRASQRHAVGAAQWLRRACAGHAGRAAASRRVHLGDRHRGAQLRPVPRRLGCQPVEHQRTGRRHRLHDVHRTVRPRCARLFSPTPAGRRRPNARRGRAGGRPVPGGCNRACSRSQYRSARAGANAGRSAHSASELAGWSPAFAAPAGVAAAATAAAAPAYTAEPNPRGC
jgi:hypothetical protein